MMCWIFRDSPVTSSGAKNDGNKKEVHLSSVDSSSMFADIVKKSVDMGQSAHNAKGI